MQLILLVEALEDVEFNDIVYSTLRDDPTADDNIILVNIGKLPRAGIAGTNKKYQ